MEFEIRPARQGDGPTIQRIEQLAGERFREVGLGSVADAEPFSIEAFTAYAASGRSWVVVDAADDAFGYAIVDVVDGCAHLEQLSIRPDRQGIGAGRALLAQVRGWAKEMGTPAITLTTFPGSRGIAPCTSISAFGSWRKTRSATGYGRCAGKKQRMGSTHACGCACA